jgi:hypothetical protein
MESKITQNVNEATPRTFGGEGTGVNELCHDCHVKILEEDDLFIGQDNQVFYFPLRIKGSILP